MTMFLRLERLLSPSTQVHLDLAGASDAPGALKPVDLVLLEQEFDALAVAVHALVLVRHASPADRASACDLDAHARRNAVRGFLEQFGRVQQRLGRECSRH